MDALFSKSLKVGNHTYFIDVREARNKARYLTISQVTPSPDGDKKFRRSSVMVFKNDVENFRDVVNEAVDILTK